MRIIGPPSGGRPTYDRLVGMGATPLFIDSIVPSLWNAALSLTVDPIGVIAQSWKETGGGKFAGKVRPEACNPCGLKIRVLGIYGPATANDEPGAHAQFANWEIGARAQCEHLRAYTGWPVPGPVVDPRYQLALKGPADWCEDWADLGGRWAPALTYGTEVEGLMRQLQGRA